MNAHKIYVFCGSENKNLILHTSIDTLIFNVKANDSIKFFVNVKDSIKIWMNVIGTKDVPNTISTNEKLFHLSRLWSEIKYNFVNIDKVDFNLDSVYKCTIERVSETKNDDEYYRELQKFAAMFKDGHTQVNDNSQFYLFQDYFKALLTDYEKKIYIISINKGSELDSTFLGAEVLEIEGKPTIKYMEENIFPYISASTEQHLWMQGTYKIHSDIKNHPFVATVKKSNGEIRKISLKRNGEATRTDNDAWWEFGAKNEYHTVGFKWLSDSIAYLEVNSFYPDSEIIAQIQKHMNSIRKAKALIVDLRSNGGGSTKVAWYIQSLFTKDNSFLNFGWQTRVNNGVKKANGNWIKEDEAYYKNCALEYFAPDTISVPDTIKRITVPTAFLIGRYTFSAAEDLLVNMYEVKDRPIFIGNSTGGSTGSPLVVSDFPGDGYARICTRRICFPYSKKPFVNEGIVPDIQIQRTFKDFVAKKDAVLDTAIGYLKTKIGIENVKKPYKGMDLTIDELGKIGVVMNENGVFFKNLDTVCKRQFGCYFVKKGDSAILSIKSKSEGKDKYDQMFYDLPTSNFDFFPIMITDLKGQKTFDTEGVNIRDLVPVLVDLSVCKKANRTDKIIIWFKNTNELKSLLPKRFDILEYLDIP
jgi:C-terminal processing protease CtpA/Prc